MMHNHWNRNANIRIVAIFWWIASLRFSAAFTQQVPNGGASTRQNLLDPLTTQDERLEEWYARHGILGLDFVKVRTTDRSVAGRGLFYCGEKNAEQGDILALIPSRCVLTHSTAGEQWHNLKRKLEEQSQEFNDASFWPTLLTAYAQQACNSNDDGNNNVAWSEWIQTWNGPRAPVSPDSLSDEELEFLANQAKSSTSGIREALEVRYKVFQQHQKVLARVLDLANENSGETDDLYGVVLSRSANLGPDWKFESGIIPLHDMLNHPPANELESVELFTIGEIVRLTSPDHVNHLLTSSSFRNALALDKVKGNDLVLVARRSVQPGEELFLSYSGATKDLPEEEKRVWRMLQYGFPLA